ncbi:MAG: DUF4783 domain-containing protein [Bacteroidota bacterium]|nr:DUF4783 domain-containing protein [Bacteroidota bacterium]
MSRKTSLFLLLVLIVSLVNGNISFGQDKWWKEKKYKYEAARIKYDLCKQTFKDIGYGFLYKNINSISPYFDSQVYLNVISNEKGYYSSSQAELILLDFMEYFTVENFKYIRSSRFNTYAFVNGVYYYMIGSGKQELDVTISLKYNENKWYIDQVTIN